MKISTFPLAGADGSSIAEPAAPAECPSMSRLKTEEEALICTKHHVYLPCRVMGRQARIRLTGWISWWDVPKLSDEGLFVGQVSCRLGASLPLTDVPRSCQER